MSKTKIEYVDLTINPVVGCSKCSPGCDNCYAEKMAYRLSKMPATAAKYAGVVDENGWTGKISALDLSCFDKLPKKACRVFVGSMTDLFNKDVPFDVQGKILSTIARNQQHTFMLLTKRADLMRKRYHTLLPNVWLGVTVCNQAEADEKIPLLLETPAAKRFVSIEPMLGPVDLNPLCSQCGGSGYYTPGYTEDGPADPEHCPCGGGNIAWMGRDGGLDWVICGGETGPGARPMHPDWVRSLRDQCHSAEVPFFFKGMIENGKKTRLLDGREWNEVPE